MQLHIQSRLGIGFDIEHNEDIIHRVIYMNENGEAHEALLCYNGLLIKLPFCTIYFGDFVDLATVLENESRDDQ